MSNAGHTELGAGYPGPNQDAMPLGGDAEVLGDFFQEGTRLGIDEEDEEEIHDLGFIVDDHDDRRVMLADGFQRLNDLDTNEALEINRSGPLPDEAARLASGVDPDRFATDFHRKNAVAEAQEQDWVQTSMMPTEAGDDEYQGDYTDETLRGIGNEILATDITGEVPGMASGLGTSLANDLGSTGFQIEDITSVPMGQSAAPGDISDIIDHGELSDYDDDAPNNTGANEEPLRGN